MNLAALDYVIRTQCARWLAAARLHRISVTTSGAQRVKQRRVCASALILAGNQWLRFERSGVRVLPVSEWHERAREVYRQVYGETATISGRALVVPNWPGRCLGEFLQSQEPGWQPAFRAAVCALAEFHQVNFASLDSEPRPMSHGDATVDNVIYDAESDTARWCDFETTHDPLACPEWRQADDLRAFVYSAASCLGVDDIGDIVDLCVRCYQNGSVLDRFRRYVQDGKSWPSLFHFAQASMPQTHRSALEAELLNGSKEGRTRCFVSSELDELSGGREGCMSTQAPDVPSF